MSALAAPISSWPAIGLIRAYRLWISPYKGFRCAHHVLHAQGSCSTFGLQAFRQHAFRPACLALRQRFEECREAYATLIMMASAEDREERKRRRGSVFDGCAPDPCLPFYIGSCDLPAGACEGLGAGAACEGIGACS